MSPLVEFAIIGGAALIGVSIILAVVVAAVIWWATDGFTWFGD